ncbi:hypothetical protein V6N13_052919 [Hibiscus sabdariffa]
MTNGSNPIDDPSFGSLGCSRVHVCVAENDILKQRGLYYCKKLKQSGWGGEVELMESPGEEHVFHLHKPNVGMVVTESNEKGIRFERFRNESEEEN